MTRPSRPHRGGLNQLFFPQISPGLARVAMAAASIRALNASSCLRLRKHRVLILIAGGKPSSGSCVQRQPVIGVIPNSRQTWGSGTSSSRSSRFGPAAAGAAALLSNCVLSIRLPPILTEALKVYVKAPNYRALSLNPRGKFPLFLSAWAARLELLFYVIDTHAHPARSNLDCRRTVVRVAVSSIIFSLPEFAGALHSPHRRRHCVVLPQLQLRSFSGGGANRNSASRGSRLRSGSMSPAQAASISRHRSRHWPPSDPRSARGLGPAAGQ